MDVSDKLLHQKVSAELETAILHSFEKNKCTVVDPMSVGKSLMTHCKRERTQGVNSLHNGRGFVVFWVSTFVFTT